MLTKDTWRNVIIAIEDAIPLYDRINEIISFGNADKARHFAVEKLSLREGLRALDSGIGPGNTSKLLLSRIEPSLLVGLDISIKQLKTAKLNLTGTQSQSVEFVRGTFEHLPFRSGIFDVIVTSYALRDSLSVEQALGEYSRVSTPAGELAIVDLGKPNGMLKRVGTALYVICVMSLIAKLAIGTRIKGNPWRWIVPTYVSLPTNGTLVKLIRQAFAWAELKEFLMGGVIVIIARKS